MGPNLDCPKPKMRKGLWSPEEDEKLYNYIARFGVGCWSSVPKFAGLQRCGKSCRLRWINYLRPDLKRGMFTQEEEQLIINLHRLLGNRWAQIATQLPGRTDNEIKNLWNSFLKKKLIKQGIDPQTHEPLDTQTQSMYKNNNNLLRNISEDHKISQKTTNIIKLEQKPITHYTPTNNNVPSNSHFSFSGHSTVSTDTCQSYQSLILGSLPMSNISDDNPLEIRNAGERDIEWFTESLMYSEGKEGSSSSSNDIVVNNIDSNVLSWENGENKLDSEFFQYSYDNYGLIKLEECTDQESLWNEEQFQPISVSQDVTATDAADFDVFLQHFRESRGHVNVQKSGNFCPQ
ncbi:hypothetical protein vseg_013931 [Gypsophila vaccaria]